MPNDPAPGRVARLVVIAVLLALAPCAGAEPLRFSITFDEALADSYTGRVYVLCGTPGRGEPRFGPAWFGRTPFVAADVTDWAPDTPFVISADNALSYPTGLDGIPRRDWTVQAVLRLNRDSPHLGSAAGNAYSAMRVVTFGGADGGAIELRVDRLVEPRPVRETDDVRLVERPSALLSAFHGRDIVMRAVVLLPDGWEDEPRRRYPTLYAIPGFGGDHQLMARMLRRWPTRDFVLVALDASCFGGHHAFADSANNGPRGTALVEELIPFIEANYPVVAAPTARFLWGHSSGGWSSLWLQVAYPDSFGGVWSTAPDPVDFRRYQLIDIYAGGANAFIDDEGNPVPVAQRDGRPFATYRDFSAMEDVYGEGGQLRSFEWVFSPRGADGLPRRLFDRTTGAIDPAVADAWKAYDIRLVLEENWATLGPKLAGKLNVFVGDEDTFYLAPAVALLKESLASLGSDAVVEIHEGHDHSSVLTRELRERIQREARAMFDRAHGAVEVQAP